MLDQLRLSPIIPVFYHQDQDYARRMVSICHIAGIHFFEFTNRGPAAREVFLALRNHVNSNCPGMQLGIGTIYTAEEAAWFLQAGAEFVVQPVTTPAVGEQCLASRIPWIPGAMTPTEIWSAWQQGATAVKIFPGSAFGPAYLRALRGPMPEVPFLVTGGVEPNEESIRSWLNAGALAVGVGAHLFDREALPDDDALTIRLTNLLKNLHQ